MRRSSVVRRTGSGSCPAADTPGFNSTAWRWTSSARTGQVRKRTLRGRRSRSSATRSGAWAFPCRTSMARRNSSSVVGSTFCRDIRLGRRTMPRSSAVGKMKRKSANGVALFLVENKPSAKRWPSAPASVTEDAAVSTLDHIVINTSNPERAVALYGGRLSLDLRLDRSNEQWGARQLFFRCGSAVVEIGASLKSPPSDKHDTFGGLAWRVRDPNSARARIAAAGIDVSEVRTGRKPGTSVFTVRSGTGGVPTLMLSGNE